MKAAERAARRAAWPKWRVQVCLTLVNGWRPDYEWDPIPAASLQAIVNRAPKMAARAMAADKVKGRSQITDIQIRVRRVG